MNITRRAALTGLTLTAAAAAIPSTLPPKSAEQLNVLNLVFHGLFAFIITDQVQVITPKYNDHVFCYLERSVYRPVSMSYTLSPSGLKAMNRITRADESSNVVIKPSDCGFRINMAGQNGTPRCRIFLPLPNAMNGFRSLPNSGANRNIWFVGGYYDKVKANKVPFVQVLSYVVTDPNQVVMTGKNPDDLWKPYLKSRTSNLHFFAEPADEVPPEHAEEAFQSLASLVHGNLTNLKCVLWPSTDPAPLEDTGVQDLWPEDERCLQERVINLPRAGIRIVNCMSLIIQE